jgi:cell division protein FtsI/penicillin-binding protein 2
MNKARAILVILIMTTLFAGLVYQLFKIQVTEHEKYARLAERQQNKTLKVQGERGTIKDRNGNLLAFTKDYVTFYAYTNENRLNDNEKETVADTFAAVFNKSKEHYLKILNSDKTRVCLEKRVEQDLALKLNDFYMDGLEKEKEFDRIYPYGSLASHILGFVNHDFEGATGVEGGFNKYLKGETGYLYVEQDVFGKMVTVNDKLSKPPQPGNNLFLTIDKTFQNILEEELIKGLKKYEGKTAVGIIMNPNTGEVKAMANLPNFDPANYSVFEDNERRNRAITDTYEPGSTMKAFSMAILLDNGLVKPDELVNTENGHYYTKGVNIKDTHPYEYLSAREIIEHSSNIGMTKLIERVNDNMFYRYLRDFGFGNELSVNLVGEISGKLKKPSEFTKTSKYFMSFGYEVAVTPLQLLSSFSALVNGGILYQPMFVNKIEDNNGNTLEIRSPRRIRRIISGSTSDTIRDFLIGAVEDGTGTNARIEGIKVGGKTGTSQIYSSRGYSSDSYNSSFVGFLPGENPELIGLILVTSPQKGRYGGSVAAPIFKNVMTRILESDLDIKKEEKPKDPIDMLITNINRKEETEEFTFSNYQEEDDKENQRYNFNGSVMPDLKNRSLRDALLILSQLGVKYDIKGSGRVVYQSVKPGKELSKDHVVTIKCESKQVIN